MKSKTSIKKQQSNRLSKAPVNQDQVRIEEARHHDPFVYLGLHRQAKSACLRVFSPHTESLRLVQNGELLERVEGTDFFHWQGANDKIEDHPQLTRLTSDGHEYDYTDPYSFPAQVSDFDLHLFNEGKHWHIYRVLGAHIKVIDGIKGVHFATWAPSAERVSVVGDFNQWDGRTHAMRNRGSNGVWELFIPGLTKGDLYKFEIRNSSSGSVESKIDPYAQYFEKRPRTACMVIEEDNYVWSDDQWIQQRSQHDWLHEPMSIYEVHLGENL